MRNTLPGTLTDFAIASNRHDYSSRDGTRSYKANDTHWLAVLDKTEDSSPDGGKHSYGSQCTTQHPPPEASRHNIKAFDRSMHAKIERRVDRTEPKFQLIESGFQV